MTTIATVAFRHIPHGISVLKLRADSTLWLAGHADVPEIKKLHGALTAGKYRSTGGRELMKLMHDRLSGEGIRVDGKQVVVAWLLAIQQDERWSEFDLDKIARALSAGDIRINEYLPLPQPQEAD